MSDTPRLEEALRNDLTTYGSAAVHAEALRLERELTAVTAERDAYALQVQRLESQLRDAMRNQ